MKTLDAGSIDAIVCDPPYGLFFMNKTWDKGVPGVPFWQEALRVAKPGTHILAAGGSRTYHRLACAIEDAGWEIRDCVMWIYGSGFPKSHDVSKAIDKAAGAERGVIGFKTVGGTPGGGRMRECNLVDRGDGKTPDGRDYANARAYKDARQFTEVSITAPATEAARQWQGWGTALKPAFEPFILARKPLDGTVASNVLTHGTGGLNVDECRVGKTVSRRWPANVIHDGSDEVMELFPQVASGARNGKRRSNKSGIGTFHENDRDTGRFFLSSQGSAARFFYCPKASRAEREAGLDGMDSIHRANGNKWTDEDYRVKKGERPPSAESGPRTNHHPTVKPVELMAYLARLITPPKGTILDPFMGSGTTGVAAVREGFNFIGIELNPEYAEIAKRRIQHEREKTPLIK